MFEIRQSLVRRPLVRGIPAGIASLELMVLLFVNLVGGLSVRKAIFSLLVGVVGHGCLAVFYAKDGFCLETLVASTRYRLVYYGGAAWRKLVR